MAADFRELFCQKHGLSPDEFQRELFWRCLFRHSIPFVFLLVRWNRDIFREDFDLVRELGSTVSRGEVVTELNRFYGRNRRVGGFWRNVCRFRVSGKRVLNVYRALIQDHEQALLQAAA